MRVKSILVVVAVVLSSMNSASVADISWSDVDLDGTFPNFSFSDATLGLVNLTYSSDTEVYGITNALGGVDTLQLGNTGGEWLVFSWTNPITNLNLQIWDIDAILGTAGENVHFTANATLFPISLHSTDRWNPTTQVLSSDGNPNANSDSTNFTVMSFVNPDGFTSIRFDWSVVGTGRMGIGEIQAVPLPGAVLLGLVGLGYAGMRLRRHP